MYASVIKREQAKLDGSKKPEKRRKIVAPKNESEHKMSIQVICAPLKKSKKKTTINTLDVSAEEMDYQKKLKWLKDHGALNGEEGNNPEEDSSGNDSA
jgi:phosphoserine aminotransferase